MRHLPSSSSSSSSPLLSPPPPWIVVSHTFLVWMLLLLGVLTVASNLMFLSPLTQVVEFQRQQQQHQQHQDLLQSIPLSSSLSKTKKQSTDSSYSSSSSSSSFLNTPEYESVRRGRERILDMFDEAQIPLHNLSAIEQLPLWSTVEQVIGTHPYIVGLDRCEQFRNTVPAVERMLGSAGMFNSGTNLVTHLLKRNCQIPERVAKYGVKASREAWGMRWQVPWGKHTPANYKYDHATAKAAAIDKDAILPVVTIRNPYSWMVSMCKHRYTAKWKLKKTNCPHLLQSSLIHPINGTLIVAEYNPVTVSFADNRVSTHLSLAHLWNDWYNKYYQDATYPFLMVRMEDLVFYAKETTTLICQCAGGNIRTDQPFQYVVDSAKADSVGHDTSTGFYQAFIKYSKPHPPQFGFSKEDYMASKLILQNDLMTSFGYTHPPPAEG